MRRPIVGVFGGSRAEPAVAELAQRAGAEIARRGWHLLTGAGPGVMEAASRGFTETQPREGLCLGIVPAQCQPNAYVEVAIQSALEGEGRNWINARTCWGALVLPGQAGTRQEHELCHRFDTPAVTLAPGESLAEALDLLSFRLSDPATR